MDKHSSTHRRMMQDEGNLLKEVNLREEGRLKVLKSELNRARNLVTVKQVKRMDEQM